MCLGPPSLRTIGGHHHSPHALSLLRTCLPLLPRLPQNIQLCLQPQHEPTLPTPNRKSPYCHSRCRFPESTPPRLLLHLSRRLLPRTDTQDHAVFRESLVPPEVHRPVAETVVAVPLLSQVSHLNIHPLVINNYQCTPTPPPPTKTTTTKSAANSMSPTSSSPKS